MDWRRVRLIATAAKPEQFPRHRLPEVALAGRSNVGKSSLINQLVRSRLARTSNTPGRTQTLNFYAIDERLCLVDLPGYGYARMPERVRRRLGSLIEEYLASRENLVGVVQLVDIRHPPTDNDRAMAEWLAHYGKTAVAVATKADKIARGQRKARVEAVARELGMPALAFSAATGEGRDELIRVLRSMVDGARPRANGGRGGLLG
ncbi:MAG: YihA family ribosome biogenesis GTP-binding protein [Firmicutes bacterium]|nr:YihA family ribosome biogenesis GTP-binding protein [Bacillota bacterium]